MLNVDAKRTDANWYHCIKLTTAVDIIATKDLLLRSMRQRTTELFVHKKFVLQAPAHLASCSTYVHV